MALVNEHFLKLQGNYLFADIAKRINAFKVTHPGANLIRVRHRRCDPPASSGLHRSDASCRR